MLRAARALIQAKVPRRRIRRSLEDLRQHLPETMPLSGLSICAVGDRVVVRDGTVAWQVDDGQYVLGLDVVVEDGELRVVERSGAGQRSPHRPPNRRTGSSEGLDLERTPIPSPRAAGLRAGGGTSTPRTWPRGSTRAGCCTSSGKMSEAESVYRRALEPADRTRC